MLYRTRPKASAELLKQCHKKLPCGSFKDFRVGDAIRIEWLLMLRVV
jgi:hypothetical protein